MIITQSEGETMAIGRQLGPTLPIGSTVLLRGELGAGKTAFVRGVAEGMGLATDDVSSPTFTLIQEYRGPLPLFHVDLYRISAAEADDLGLEELNQQGVVAIEWAEKLSRAPEGAVDVQIEDLGGDARRVTIVTPDQDLPNYSTR
ncbi:MAG: tRNA (adenosine(37)-N6)-threonylcarbamoyltransferase complex ATPase subunit type 1 TsaE [Acidobacteria bacterium]|nr:tRNA (adenosine(37)-N6)-threonylcarbamoyltransferase complex ATPase subunit type 1 TsaE [Acidobacteriota bacterium]